MGHDHQTAHHAGKDSKTKFAVIFALLLFFALSVAGQMVFVGDEASPGVEHFTSSDEAADNGQAHDEDAAEERPHKVFRKKH